MSGDNGCNYSVTSGKLVLDLNPGVKPKTNKKNPKNKQCIVQLNFISNSNHYKKWVIMGFQFISYILNALKL